jgi:hypothetical protein
VCRGLSAPEGCVSELISTSTIALPAACSLADHSLAMRGLAGDRQQAGVTIVREAASRYHREFKAYHRLF